ncbi:uncharacterized protein ASCRUDRAFT_71769 [Ascoidea rubescens DSM 1968]|uniref:Uncharacterized protein n=1 Tax=Ascoidea rubescens DSM 1968 TaxID=1344418 RepID=A0A1D2VD74_9ASCO|nr:hypothetical protein ASCRUDRAFT_71769 [Ascoidea rubescens DSM 1968]ODV59417.1 hypothetical protein ASCRUDRAFT_71769 [Ascoidea rubescens DSM 1968]
MQRRIRHIKSISIRNLFLNNIDINHNNDKDNEDDNSNDAADTLDTANGFKSTNISILSSSIRKSQGLNENLNNSNVDLKGELNEHDNIIDNDYNNTNLKSLNDSRLLDSFFSLHSIVIKNQKIKIIHNSPFYISEIIPNNLNPNFIDINFNFLQFLKEINLSNLTRFSQLNLKIWARYSNNDDNTTNNNNNNLWNLIISININLSNLIYLDNDIQSLQFNIEKSKKYHNLNSSLHNNNLNNLDNNNNNFSSASSISSFNLQLSNLSRNPNIFSSSFLNYLNYQKNIIILSLKDGCYLLPYGLNFKNIYEIDNKSKNQAFNNNKISRSLSVVSSATSINNFTKNVSSLSFDSLIKITNLLSCIEDLRKIIYKLNSKIEDTLNKNIVFNYDNDNDNNNNHNRNLIPFDNKFDKILIPQSKLNSTISLKINQLKTFLKAEKKRLNDLENFKEKLKQELVYKKKILLIEDEDDNNNDGYDEICKNIDIIQLKVNGNIDINNDNSIDINDDNDNDNDDDDDDDDSDIDYDYGYQNGDENENYNTLFLSLRKEVLKEKKLYGEYLNEYEIMNIKMNNMLSNKVFKYLMDVFPIQNDARNPFEFTILNLSLSLLSNIFKNYPILNIINKKTKINRNINSRRNSISSVNTLNDSAVSGRDNETINSVDLANSPLTATISNINAASTATSTRASVYSTRKDLFSILSLTSSYKSNRIDNNLLLTTYQEIEIDSAMGFVVKLVNLIALYLSIPLRYPMTFLGSKSYIYDPISKISSSKIFPLWLKDNQNYLYKFEYGLILLNKNIEQLCHEEGLVVPESRNILGNLKTLLLYLASKDR